MRQLARLLVLFFVIYLPLTSLAPLISAAAVSPWLATELPSITKISDLAPDVTLSLVPSINNDCQNREVITRPAMTLPYPQTKISHTGCVTDTAYGAVNNGSYLQRQGSNIFGSIKYNSGSSALVIPIPRSSTGIVVGSGNYSGSSLSFIKNLDTNLSSSVIYTGEVTHKLPPAPFTSTLKDASGQVIVVQADTIGFSANGEWMAVDAAGIGTLRVNTATFEVLPFGAGVNYNAGLGPNLRTAISPDGRYAVVASKLFGVFRLYDLSTCGPVAARITTHVPCQSRDLLPHLKQKVPNFSSIFRMRFRGPHSVDVFVNSVQNNVTTTSLHSMVATGQSNAGYDYLALGDSFASGEGAYQYKSITDTSENKCHLSLRSYPYLISNALGFGQHESVACSGAIIDDFLRSDAEYKGQVKDGKSLDDRDVGNILSALLPGYIAQKEFVQNYQPNAITLSAGGNDIGFSDKIKRCLDSDTCYSSYEDRLEIVREINAQFYRLTDMYTQIKAAAAPQTRIYVVGYPQIAVPNGNCALNVHLNNDEIIFSNQLVGYLNSVIATATANTGVFYVDTETALAGHRFCETDSWNVAVNGLTAGNDVANLPLIHGPIGNESYHPNALGNDLIKTRIISATNNLTAPMPTPNDKLAIADKTDGLGVLNAPKTGRTMRYIKHYSGLDGGIIQYGKTWVKTMPGVTPYLKAKSAVEVWLNSAPVSLGTYTLDESGSLNIFALIPATVPAGFHTLHMYGKNDSGESIDLYAVVYVGSSESDFDGDGLSNTANPCLIVPPSGTDSDKDSIDDACDPIISQAPPPPAPVETPPTPTPDPIVTPPGPTPPEPTPPAETPPPTNTALTPPSTLPIPPSNPVVDILPLPVPPPIPAVIPDLAETLPIPLPTITTPAPSPVATSQPTTPPPVPAASPEPSIEPAASTAATIQPLSRAIITTLPPNEEVLPNSTQISSDTTPAAAPKVAGLQTTKPSPQINSDKPTSAPTKTSPAHNYPLNIIFSLAILSLLVVAMVTYQRHKRV